MKLVSNFLLALSLVFLCNCRTSPGQAGKALHYAQQEAFLSKRTSAGMMMGTFDSYCSYLYAVKDVAIHTESDEINRTKLRSPFPDFYRPTWRELFDTIARQTKSSWTYDASRNYWVFGPPSQPLTFEITLLEAWKAHDEGLYVGYQPSIAPVGMDIYVLGCYSAEKEADEEVLFRRIREAIAVRFASNLKRDVSAREMTEIPIGKLRALHFQTEAPTGIVWRQWVVVESGMAFAIVSAIKPEHEKTILPDVMKMVASFRVLDIVPKSDHPAAGQAGIASLSAIEPRCPGLPEPGRSAPLQP